MKTTHKHTIQLSQAELVRLQSIIGKGKHKAQVINRARILQYSHKGISKDTIAQALDINRSTVQRTRDNYRDDGLERALYDAPRSGQPRKLDDKTEAYLVALTCSDPPKGRERWTLKLLQQKMIEDKKVNRISDVCILSYLNNHSLKPWREKNVVRAEAHARVH
jgi:transposase